MEEHLAPGREAVVDADRIGPPTPAPAAFLVALRQVLPDRVAVLGRERVPGDLVAADLAAREERREDVERVALVALRIVGLEAVQVGLGGIREVLRLVRERLVHAQARLDRGEAVDRVGGTIGLAGAF